MPRVSDERPSLRGRPSDVLKGTFRLFSSRDVTSGLPPDWYHNQLTGEQVPYGIHWSRIGDFRFGDIKGVWELSRFGWAFDLVRDGSSRARDLLWLLLADWMGKNPPNEGPNWMCGQEASIRLVAVVFAAERFGVQTAQQEALARFIVATAQRVEANIDYALSQQNNHGISECVGLLTAALLVPSHPEAGKWEKRAMVALREQVESLVYDDGAFSQHSLVYHRVALDMLCWAALRMRGYGLLEPDWLVSAGKRATAFLRAIIDPATGDGPLYGANDGAQIIPLTEGSFVDMRPTVQLGTAVFDGQRCYIDGPWDEKATWLVPNFKDLPLFVKSLSDMHAPQGGLVQIVSGPDRLILRCPTAFAHRPSQADFGHVDVWLGNRAVAIDAGSYSYNSKERFTAFNLAREHNALTIDGIEPMRKVTRFLFVPWPKAHLQKSDPLWRYQPDFVPNCDARWTRSVAPRVGGGFTVTDKVEGAAGQALRWHWRLVDLPWQRSGDTLVADDIVVKWTCELPLTVDVVRQDTEGAAGWRSIHYAEVEPAVSLVPKITASRELTVTFDFFLNRP